MDNAAIAKLLRNIAAAYSVLDEKRFRFQIIAYNNASGTIESMTTQVRDLYKEDALDAIPGIGESLKGHIQELLKTGHVEKFDEVFGKLPPAMFPLLDIPGFGPKKAFKLVTHFHITDPKTVFKDLEKYGKEGKIAELDGFGEKSQTLILQSLEAFSLLDGKQERMNLPFANELAEKIMAYLRECKEVIELYPLGSLRRKVSTIGDVDIAVTTDHPDIVLAHFAKYPYVERVIQVGKNESSFFTAGGKRVDLRVQDKKSFGSLLQHFTGSKNHNVALREYALKKGISLSEWGIRPSTAKSKEELTTYESEEKFYNALGLDWIAPELRENTGEIEAAKNHTLPNLITLKDITGDFHIHSSYPCEESHDAGRDSMETMLARAEELGYTSFGFSEHNPSISGHTKEQIVTLLKGRMGNIERLIKSNKNLRIFSLLETDILPTGELAIPEEAFEYLDGTLVSIHSSFSQSKEQMTKRILKGLSHPKVKIFAHPTARLINQRHGIEADWEQIFTYCRENHIAMEINAAPARLDLPDQLARTAIQEGVTLVIDTDSHDVSGMDLMEYGVYVARRAWAEKKDILNTWEPEKIEAWFKK
jgi:DNA polymerase (family 10)